MIDKSRHYWYVDSPDDIDEYLREYSECPSIEVKPVICNNCGNDALHLRVDQNEDAIQEIEDIAAQVRKCHDCKTKEYNIRVGFIRRENGSVKWVYIGNRCTNCGLLGSYLDWKISYEPTDKMEINI